MKKIISILAFGILIFNISICTKAAEVNDNSGIDVLYAMVEAVSEKNWDKFTQLMISDEQVFYEYYFASNDNQNGIKQVNDIEILDIIPIEKEVAQEEMLVGEYPILATNVNIECYIVSLDCKVDVENEFFFYGVNYFLVVLAEENGVMKITQFNRPSMQLLENSLISVLSDDEEEYERKMEGINVIRQAENGLRVNAENEILDEGFNLIYVDTLQDDGISLLATGTSDFPNLSSYTLYSYPENIYVKMNKTGSGEIKSVEMETYIKCTLPNEWYGSWDIDALKAGAYCVKMAGWYRTLKPVNALEGYHVTQYTQNYVENSNYSTTDAAVNAIRCSGMADSNCKLFYPEYAKGVEGNAGTKASGKLRQYGSQYLATEKGYSYRQILNYYYSGSAFSDGDVVLFSYEE